MSTHVLHPTLAVKRAERLAGPSKLTDHETTQQAARTPSPEEGHAARRFWQGPLAPIEALLPDSVNPKRLLQMPTSSRRSYVRAVRGEASLREAVRAFCAECCGYDRDAVRTCPAVACPLHSYRPWQRQREGRSKRKNAPATEAPTSQPEGGSYE